MAKAPRLPIMLAADLRDQLSTAFHDGGWPVVHGFAARGDYVLHTGPVVMEIGRTDPLEIWPEEDVDPDDADLFDLTVLPTITVGAPIIAADHKVELRLDRSTDLTDIVRRIGSLLTRLRTAALHRSALDSECPVCCVRYPSGHLLGATLQDRRETCPACVFDGDSVPDRMLAGLACDLDLLLTSDLSTPAGWSAVIALLACVSRSGLRERLAAQWQERRLPWRPQPYWSQPGEIWVWLPGHDRPAGLEHFGPGARLSAIVEALDAAYPGLRGRVRTEVTDGHTDAERHIQGGVVEMIWPALLAYWMAFTAQAADRLQQRSSSEFVVPPFTILQDYWAEVGSELDAADVGRTLDIGLAILHQTFAR